MDRVEATGRTVEDAIANALLRLRAVRSDVDVQVITEGSRGILGIGAEDARVVVIRRVVSKAETTIAPTVTPQTAQGAMASVEREGRRGFEKDEPSELTLEEENQEAVEAIAVASDELVEFAVGMAQDLLDLLQIKGEVEVRSRSFPLTINIRGDDMGVLIGRHGETLESLQFLYNLIVSRKMGHWTHVTIDVEEYRLRREQKLRQIASRAAERVRRTRQAVTLEPMPSNERRIVHLALQGDRYVSTHSIGEGDNRKVVISPRGR